MTDGLEHWQGRILDNQFPLREYLGGGRKSAVFVTEHLEPEPRQAAVKLIAVDAGREGRELGRAEAAAQLSHPGLIQLFQVGLWRPDDVCLLYLVMEYAEENLAQVLTERALTTSEMREVLASALDALAYIHRAGFAHARLKPSNILAVGDHIRISSDGLYQGRDTKRLRELSVYDAPEMITGEMTPAGDVWSLAMLMVEGLTQQLPAWDGADNKLILPETLPEPFLEIARHCLHTDSRQRWTIGQIADRLRAASHPVASTGGSPQRTAIWNRSVWRATMAIPALAAILIGGKLLYPHPEVRQDVPRTASRRVVKPVQRVRKGPEVVKDYQRPSPFGNRGIARGSIGKMPSCENPKPFPERPKAMGTARDARSAAVSEADRLIQDRSTETGRAVFFSSNANGGLTASGARLNSEELMAGHASYPLGSLVKVTNLANGKTVEVRIVDRLPESSQRIINLSAAAARELDFLRAGTAMVRLELVPQNTGR